MILVNSIFSSKLAEEVYALKSTVNYLGVDTESFSPHQSVLRKKLGLDECKIILLPARLHRVKCVDDIILATEKIVKHEDKVKTIIIGTGPEELSLKRMTRELGLTSNVLFWGDTVNSIVPQHYGMADVVVNLSLYEPFGLVPVEGMACGKPVVVYDSGGPAETVLDRVTGVKVKPRDVGHLSDEILAIIQNPRRGREMGLRGRERVLGNYTWELTAKRLLQAGESS
jgi:glycosyltransferase involved in cell wall biosynthesis